MTSVKEPETDDQSGSKHVGKELPPALTCDGELFNDHLRAGDVEEGSGGYAREDNVVDFSLACNGHADAHSNWRSSCKDAYHLSAEAEVVREGLYKGYAKRQTSSFLVNNDGDHHVKASLEVFGQTNS